MNDNPPPRVRRHLIDPAQPRQSAPASSMSITSVQRWVLSSLAVTTILHLAFGLVIAAAFLDDADLDGRIGLNVIAGLVGVGAVAAARGIHQRSILTPWLLLGFLVTAFGLWITF